MKISASYLSVLLMLSTAVCAVADEQSAAGAQAAEAREKAFVEQMANSVLVGFFTVDGKSDDQPLKEERYEIDSVAKASGNLWVFTARVKYGNIDTRLPITVPMEWAGDTPMVSLTNASLPGLGTEFSARVLFYEDRYAGTWQHGKVGGHMFGKIEKQSTASASPDK